MAMPGLRAVGPLIALLISMAFVASPLAGEINYTYDDLGRLTKTQYGAPAGSPPTLDYVYDPAGNRTNHSISNSTQQPAPPDAVNDSISTRTNTAKTFDPRTNDTDPNNDPLTITAKTDGANGTVAIISAGTQLTYTPNTGYTGADSFTYTISDGQGGTDTATVSVTVTANAAPVAANDSISTALNTALTFDPRGNDSDTDGDTLTIIAKTDGANGTVAIISAGTQLTYTPNTGYTGADSFTYTISDGFGGSATGTVNATVTAGSTSVYSVANASAAESAANVVFTVTRTGTPAGTETINYATTSGTATGGGTDFTTTSGQLTFTTSDSNKPINVPINNDTLYEGNETFTVTLSSPSAGSIGTGTATGTITDNDNPPSFAINNASATEGSNVTFTVTKTGGTAFTHAVNYATSSGTATSGTDFTAKSGTLTFTSGQTSQTFSVTTTDDSTVESAETFNVTLSGATNSATISDNSGVGTINDNDGPITLTNSSGVVQSGHTSTYTGTMSCSYIDYPFYGNYCTYTLTLNSTSAVKFSAFGLQTDGNAIPTTSSATGYSRPSSTTLVITVTPAQYGQ